MALAGHLGGFNKENVAANAGPREANSHSRLGRAFDGIVEELRLAEKVLEVVRGDWAAVAKNLQERVLEILLKEKSPPKATDYVRKYIADVKSGKVPYSEFIIWKTLTKAPEEYSVRAPHVEAAKLLKKEGLDLTLGDKVGYVITKGEGKLYTKAKPYMFATEKDVDTEYYVANQVVPAAARILAMFNVREEELYGRRMGKTSLSDFLPEEHE